MKLAREVSLRALGMLLVVAAAPLPQALAQEVVGPDGEPTTQPRVVHLFANRDAASSGLRSVGFFDRVCIDNFTGIFGQGGCTPLLQFAPSGFVTTYFRGARWGFGVPKTDWQRAVVKVPELANAIGGGWTVADVGAGNFDDTGPADGGLGLHHSGEASTSDRSCRDHTDNFGAGRFLLAGSDCPVTWGSEGFKGARPVPLDVYLNRFTAGPATFGFDFWRISDAEVLAAGVEANKYLGNFQAYGFTSDYGENVLCGSSVDRNYAHVIPAARQPAACATAEATRRRSGWPLGIEIRVEGFTFQLPAIKDVAYYQVTFTNRSKDLYGVGLDYDSLYISLLHGMFSNLGQQASVYNWIQNNTRVGSGSTFALCNPARNITDIRCDRLPSSGAPPAWRYGVTALMVLKSPIGDMRNKWFSIPGNPFYSPAHVLAGDTITYNHSHMCGFRNCGASTYAVAVTPPLPADIEQRVFGMISSTETNVFGERTAASTTDIPDFVYYHTFRPHGYPTRYPTDPVNGGFPRYVPPGNWDYNHDGILDTLRFDSCHLNGCVGLFSDTMTNGALNGYSNTHGNMGVGPIRLLADSTVGFVLAITTASDSLTFLSQVQAGIDHYMNFYLGPEAAPKCRVVGVSRAPAAEGTSVRFVWNDACFPGWTDKFLLKQGSDVATAPGSSPLGRLRQLNPWLVDTLTFLATNNLARVHIFKSCDDGASWTDDDDCEGDPVSAGPFASVGYLPLATFETGASTGLPTGFSDAAVLPGRTFTYNVVGETRGAEFTVINGDSVGVNAAGDSICMRNCRVESLSLAPALFNALAASTGEPNVARVYVPLSLPAGGSRSRVNLVSSAGPMPGSRIGISVNADSIPAADYRVLFGDSARAYQIRRLDRTTGALKGMESRLVLRAPGDSTIVRGANPGLFTASGTTAGTEFAALDTVISSGTPPDTTIDSLRVTPYVFATGPVMALTQRFSVVVAGPPPTMVQRDSNPLLVSSTLTGASATPAAFHAHTEYPGFDLSVDRTLSNKFQGQFWLQADGSPVTFVTEPTTAWLTGGAVQDTTSLTSNQANGEYAITWQARPFGPGEPFRLDFNNVAGTVATIVSSLNQRATASTGARTDSAAAAIAAAGNPGFTIDSLVALRLPFTVRNLSYNRDVIVAKRNRPVAGLSIEVGNGLDILSVPVPSDVWVPGDTVFLIERVDTNGRQAVTFRRAVIGCDPINFTRVTCNPVAALTRGASVYLGARPGQVQHVTYHTPITASSQFTYQAVAPVRGTALTGQPGLVRAGLAAVRVVPNPFIMLSQYGPDNERGQRLMFTHLPPRGNIRIFTVAGQFVQQISWTETNLGVDGDLSWNMRSREGNPVAGGLYLYVLTALDAAGGVIGTRTDKFVVIR